MFAIVGAGDVVSRLVLPALRAVGVSGWEVHGLLSDPSVLADGTRVYRHSVESLPPCCVKRNATCHANKDPIVAQDEKHLIVTVKPKKGSNAFTARPLIAALT